jgi:hypothetical protein
VLVQGGLTRDSVRTSGASDMKPRLKVARPGGASGDSPLTSNTQMNLIEQFAPSAGHCLRPRRRSFHRQRTFLPLHVLTCDSTTRRFLPLQLRKVKPKSACHEAPDLFIRQVIYIVGVDHAYCAQLEP